MTDASRLILVDAWRQCERHLHHLRHALDSLSSALPVTADSLSRFDDEAVQDWDQFVLRFTKLQDAIGTRLFPAVLSFLPSIEAWNTLRSIRNHFAHDYPQDDALKAAYLNEAVSAVAQMESLLVHIQPLVNAH
jgi:hypothetical protein